MRARVENLLAQIGEQKRPPLHLWQPPLSGDIDIEIRRDGSWWHEGGQIARIELVRLFASILCREGDDYFLVTPVEKWRLRVADAPFVAVALEVVGEGADRLLVFDSNVGERVACDAEHPLRVATRDGGEPAPYLLLRDGLWALLSRSVFYELVELAEARDDELIVHSRGAAFSLGRIDE